MRHSYSIEHATRRADPRRADPRTWSLWTWSLFIGLLIVVFALGCRSGAVKTVASAPVGASTTVDDRCAFPTASTLVKREGSAVLKVWQFEAAPVFTELVVPRDSALAAYRQTIVDAGADLVRPLADPPSPKDANEETLWRHEAENIELVFSGRAGRVREIQCLEALLFAEQNRRYSEITQPTEFIASVLRKQVDGKALIRAYFSGSDQMFPPKSVYGFDKVEADVGDGWSFWFVLHNHTVQKNNGKPALGTPTLSTSDADLHRALSERLGLQSARITNGFFTAEIPAQAFHLFKGR